MNDKERNQLALNIAKKLKVDFDKVDKSEYLQGFKEEYEHGTKFPEYDVTGDNPVAIAKIALVHIVEDPKYYSKLKQCMESMKLSSVLKQL